MRCGRMDLALWKGVGIWCASSEWFVGYWTAPVFGGSRLTVSIRMLMIASGVLALAGLGGVVTRDMQLRNIGIVGYLGVFLVVACFWLSCSFKPDR